MANILVIVTGLQPSVRNTGCGCYLLVLSCSAEVGLVTLTVKTLFLVNVYAQKVSCAIIEMLLATSAPLVDWLAACVAVDRAVAAVIGVSLERTKSIRAARCVTVSLFTFVVTTAIYRPLNQHLLNDPRRPLSWCILKFNTAWLSKYHVILNIVHLIVPFLINFISAVILFSSIVRRKFALKNSQQPSRMIFYEQLSVYKHSLTSPMILLVLGMPRLVFTFALACLVHSWQKQVYLIGYFVSVLPLATNLLIFLLPSPTYREQLKGAIIKRFIRRCNTNCTRN